MDGIILINKEEKYTSQDVCNVIKKIFNTSKVPEFYSCYAIK